MSATIAAPSIERRHCWTSLTTTDGVTICGTIDAGWYVLGPQNRVLAKYPDDGGITNALIRYRKEGNGLTRQEDAERTN